MCKTRDFSRAKVFYNLFVATIFLIAGSLAAASLGLLAVIGSSASFIVGVVMALTCACNRCAYFGRRCALGLGTISPLLASRGRPEEFFRTFSQYLCVVLLAIMPILGIVGSVYMLLCGRILIPILFFLSMLAFLVPHPKLMCSQCEQARRGLCPIGRSFVRM